MRYHLFVCAMFAAVSTFPLGALPANAGEQLRIGGTGSALEYSRTFAGLYADRTPGMEITVHEGLGSSGGIRAVIAGAIDLAISGRPLNADETSRGLVATPVLKTPFGFFTSRLEPVDVRREEIAHLYKHPGCDCHWFGGEQVRIILRPYSESDVQLAVRYFEGLEESLASSHSRRGVPVALTDQDNADLAEMLKTSLTMGTLLQMVSENRDLRPLLIDGVAPTVETMRSGEYPFTKTLYIVHRETPPDAVRNFVTFLFSDEAAGITERLGAIVVR